jgi:aspartate 1-decarboxylase
VGLNGPAARKGMVGDEIVIIAYALMTPEEARTNRPKIIILGENNDVIRTL